MSKKTNQTTEQKKTRHQLCKRKTVIPHPSIRGSRNWKDYKTGGNPRPSSKLPSQQLPGLEIDLPAQGKSTGRSSDAVGSGMPLDLLVAAVEEDWDIESRDRDKCSWPSRGCRTWMDLRKIAADPSLRTWLCFIGVGRSFGWSESKGSCSCHSPKSSSSETVVPKYPEYYLNLIGGICGPTLMPTFNHQRGDVGKTERVRNNTSSLLISAVLGR